MAARERPWKERRTDVAEMQKPGRARRESGAEGRHCGSTVSDLLDFNEGDDVSFMVAILVLFWHDCTHEHYHRRCRPNRRPESPARGARVETRSATGNPGRGRTPRDRNRGHAG